MNSEVNENIDFYVCDPVLYNEECSNNVEMHCTLSGGGGGGGGNH